MITVCTGFSPVGYDQYASWCLDSFARHWPKDVRLVAYVERPVVMPRGAGLPLSVTGINAFIDAWKDTPLACGREPTERWKDNERAAKYSYKWDAVKFCRQLAIPAHAAEGLPDGDTLVWLDADVLAFRPVPASLVSDLLGDADLCYLGRGAKHSEIGFWAVKLSPATREFLNALRDVYISEDVFGLREWHSAYVFDYVRGKYAPKMVTRDLSPGGRGHVWFTTPLGNCLDHLKGDRKRRGRSAERRG